MKRRDTNVLMAFGEDYPSPASLPLPQVYHRCIEVGWIMVEVDGDNSSLRFSWASLVDSWVFPSQRRPPNLHLHPFDLRIVIDHVVHCPCAGPLHQAR